MTPKEKAKEIYNNFDMIIYTDQDHYNQVKSCSLFAVQECIDLHYNLDGDRNGIGDSYKYWLEVKQEIEKL